MASLNMLGSFVHAEMSNGSTVNIEYGQRDFGEASGCNFMIWVVLNGCYLGNDVAFYVLMSKI